MASRLLERAPVMEEITALVEQALHAASRLPSPPAYRTWCLAYLAGRSDDEEAAKRAFRSVWFVIAGGRFDDFGRLLAMAEMRRAALRREEIAGWVHATAARAVLELLAARRMHPSDAARAKATTAAELAAAAMRFAHAAGDGGVAASLSS